MWHIVPWWYTHMHNKVWLCQRTRKVRPEQSLKPYKFDIEVEGQGHIRIMNVLDTSSLGDRPICQIWYANVKANRSYRLDMKTWQKPIKLTWRSKVNIQSGSWMYTTHRLMVIHPCAKYGRPMSNQKKVMGRTRKHVKNPINLTLRSKFKVVSGFMNVRDTSSHGDTPNLVSQCQTIKKLWAGHESAQTDGQTEWFLYTPPELRSRGV